MVKIVLIQCVKKKLNHKATARDLYISPLFKLSLAYAKKLMPDNIYILSAKYYLLDLDREIEPYNVTLNHMPVDQVKKWAQEVLKQLQEQTDLKQDHFIFLAGKRYRMYLTPYIASYEVPLNGFKIGQQLQHLTKLIYE
jgi:hypothetical protein